MAKNVIRLTESKLKQLIEACVKETIENLEDEGMNEISYGLAKRAYDKMMSSGQHDRANKLNKTHGEIYNDDDVQYNLQNDALTLRGDKNDDGYRPFVQFRYGENKPYVSPTGREAATNSGTPNLTNDPRMARKYAQAANRYTGTSDYTHGNFRK